MNDLQPGSRDAFLKEVFPERSEVHDETIVGICACCHEGVSAGEEIIEHGTLAHIGCYEHGGKE